MQGQNLTETFTYDASDQLTAATETQNRSYTLSVSYDNWGKMENYDILYTDLLNSTTTQDNRMFSYPSDPSGLQAAQTLFAPEQRAGTTDVAFTFGINGSLRRREVSNPQPYTEYYLFNSAANMKAYSNNGLDFAYYGYNAALPKYAFNAKELDEETGMYYYEERYYKPPVFTSRDAMMDQKPWLTPYHYCSNNPVGKVDPSGMLDEDNPVFTSDGIYLGCTKEGYTGTVLICDAPLNISEFTADELLSQSGGNLAFTYDDVRYRLSNNAKSNIWTHIVSQWEGLDVHGETFSMGTIKDSRIAYDKQENIYNWCTKRGDNSICGADEYGDSYETTVENIQASVVFHEWYGHIIKGYSDDNNNHSICYSLSLQSPIYKNTTLKYKRFINQQLDYYLGVEIGIIIDSFKNQIGNR